jgi:hypothetical protein
MKSPIIADNLKRCPVCQKNLLVLKQRHIVEKDGIKYCNAHCLESVEKKDLK